MRNHNILKRDGIIQQVAKAVGPGHKVDLKNYDLLILVEVYTVRAAFLLACTSLEAFADMRFRMYAG